ncbi:MAG: Mur ligase domain-containing protein, partial [Armatimonadota bacterium]
MIHLRLSKLAEVCRGQVLQPTARAEIIGVSTDSRTVTPGQAFFALQGERFDGHDFAGDAAARGAAAVVVSRDVRDALPDSCGAVRVEDTVSALGRLARWYRDHFD